MFSSFFSSDTVQKSNMPRKHQRTTDRGLIPEAVYRDAVKRVLNGESAKSVAKELDIPRTSLRRKVDLIKTNETAYIGTNYGVTTVFTPDQEKTLSDFLEESSKMFHGLSTKAARQLAFQMATVNKIKTPQSWMDNGEAGEEWLRLFLKRHSNLSIRRPEATSLARASAFNRHNINAFFDILENMFKTYGIEGRQIYNLDESGFTTVQKMPKVIAPRGMKQVGQVTSRERGELVTVCAIVSAVGTALPPVFVFPRKKFQAHMLNNAPEGSLGLVTDSGWMTGEKFLPVLQHFVKHARPSADNPVVLVLDNHESHLHYPALLYARENNIHIVTLVPHTSNKTQPLDLAVFGPVKTYFNERATSWMVRNPGKTLTIYNIAELVGSAWIRGARPENIIAGFRASGIWPLDRHVFTDDEFTPSQVTDRPMQAAPAPEPQSSTSGSNDHPVGTSPTPDAQPSTSGLINHAVETSPTPDAQPSTSGSTDHPVETAPTPSALPSTSGSADHHVETAPGPQPLTPFSADRLVEAAPTPQPSTSGLADHHVESASSPGPQPSTSGLTDRPAPNPQTFISPQQFLGFPKAPPRSESTRGRKRGKCMVATASPHMKTLRDKESEKAAKIAKQKGKSKRVLVFDDSDDDIDMDVETLLESDGSLDLEEGDNDEDSAVTLGVVAQVSVGDYVLCQYDSKKSSVFYVGIVTKEIDEDFDVEVDFLRKNPKMKGKFVKPYVPEIAAVPIDVIKAKLTRVNISGSTARTQNVYFFNENLDTLNMN